MKDTITINFTISADYETLQNIRKEFAEKDNVDNLTKQLHSVLQYNIVNLWKISDFDLLKPEINAPKMRESRKGKPQSPLPVIEKGILSWHDPDLNYTSTIGKLGDKYVIEFLEHEKSFRFIGLQKASFTATKNKGGYWYAQKRVNGKLRKKYLGKTEKFTLKKLNKIAEELSQSRF